ncbi:MAG TPA: RNA 2',3'-cyclic phosphodiesterase [Ignavibacteriaceae bacterium]|nr:RNA 2',3'-cyclic phosphodiesterase [Ignavibacteriaceae bacterium]
MHRLFISLDIPPEIKTYISELLCEFKRTTKHNIVNLRWEAPEKYHITLKFIGNLSGDNLKLLIRKMFFLENRNSFQGYLDIFSAFPNEKNPRIIISKVEIQPKIYDLIVEINEQLNEMGHRTEAMLFKPHITLLRLKENYDTSFINELLKLEFKKVEMKLDQVTIYDSKLKPSGSEYHKIQSYKLI